MCVLSLLINAYYVGVIVVEAGSKFQHFTPRTDKLVLYGYFEVHYWR